jgi:D-alanyl-D-alanine carboxypeptidase (penicillin-binding protein 5/6)
MKQFKIILISFIFSFFHTTVSTAIDINANYVILQDHLSGKILFEKDADTRIYPASMTKIMTTIVVFDLLKNGETSLDEMIPVSEKAWRMSTSGYSSMFVMLNDTVSVEDLLKGIIIVSGNDACVALAEGLSGTEKDFVVLMNEKAEKIGMENTRFSNSSGLSDPDNYSTVRDILKMSRYLIQNYPEYYSYYKETSFTWDRTGGDPITQGNRNPLLYKNIGADGIKTGFLTVEKYSLASSIKVGARRLTAVGSGFETINARSKESIKILTWGLRSFDTIQIAEKNTVIANLDVWLGKKNKVEVFVNEDIYLTVPKRKKSIVKAFIEYTSPIRAPIEKGDKLGSLSVFVEDKLIKKVDIFSNEKIKRTNIFSRILKSFNFLVWGDA